MRAKMMIISGCKEASGLSLCVQQVLTDLAVAFGHSFVMVEDKISQLSLLEYDSPMTEEAVEEALQCDGVLCITPDQEGLMELAEGLDCVLKCHVYALPDSLKEYSPLKSGLLPSGVLSCPLTSQEHALKSAADHMYSLARDLGLSIQEIPYAAKRSETWDLAAQPAAARHYLNQRRLTDTPSFIKDTIVAPDQMGILFASPAACASVHAVAEALCGVETFIYDSYWDNQGPRLHVARVSPRAGIDSANPFGMLYAVADMLRYRLGLTQEADFLLTCCANVLDAGWRTADIIGDNSMRVSTEAIFRLISEQIELVAALAAH